MFEEVPRRRSGFAGLTARRVVLGPFAVGGGVLIAAIGGSVAVAATVFTASAIHVNDSAPQHVGAPVLVTTASHRPAAQHITARTARPIAPSTVSSPVPSRSYSIAVPATTSVAPPTPSRIADPARTTAGAVATTSSAPSATRPAATPTPTTSHSDPAGNALIYLSDYDAAAKQLRFEYAEQLPAGADGTPTYQVISPREFTAGLADTMVITSGGTVCGQAGNVCTQAELIAAVQSAGLFASVGVGPGGVLQSVVELPDHSGTGQIGPAPVTSTTPATSAPTPAATPSTTPTA